MQKHMFVDVPASQSGGGRKQNERSSQMRDSIQLKISDDSERKRNGYIRERQKDIYLAGTDNKNLKNFSIVLGLKISTWSKFR